jgi:hypothetical protein
MAKQPFYHEVTILFTATCSFALEEVQALLEAKLKHKNIVRGTIIIDRFDEPEPGDPADLD